MDARAEIGRRIARQRRRRGLTQAVVAGLVGRSESWLSQVERGLRSIDSHSVLVRLAEVLDVDLVQLTTDDTGADMAKYEAAAPFREAMLQYETLPATINPDIGRVGRPRLRWLRYELEFCAEHFDGKFLDHIPELERKYDGSVERTARIVAENGFPVDWPLWEHDYAKCGPCAPGQNCH